MKRVCRGTNDPNFTTQINPDCSGSHIIPEQIEKLRRSHDELLEAAKEAVMWMKGQGPGGVVWTRLAKLENAIAQAEAI